MLIRSKLSVLPWLSWKEKLVSAIVISSAVIIALCILFLVLLGPAASPGDEEHYSDLITSEGSTCWESNVFASKYDPLYDWIRSSSLAAAFKSIAVERVSIAYQRASVWRVSSEVVADLRRNNSANVTRYYNSPNPHLLGGVIHHERNWISRMTINWGLSILLCLHVDPTHVDNTCTKTTPIVWSDENSLAALMAEIPFAKASATMFQEESPYVSSGSYLSNFACSARRGVCLRGNDKCKQPEGNYWKYIYSSEECKKTSPILYATDVVSYLAFPSLQCGCAQHPKVCIIGFNLTSNENSRLKLKLNTTACETSETFWHLLDTLNYVSNETTMFIYATFSSVWNLSVTLNVSFNHSRLELSRSLGWKPLVELSSCVEHWLGRQTERPGNGTGILRFCSRKNSVFLSARHSLGDIFSRYQIVHYPSEVVDNIVPVEMKSDPYCGITRGQIDRGFCAVRLDEIYTREQVQVLLNSIGSFSRVADIQQFSRKEWKKGSPTRSEVSIELITTMLALAVTVTGMLSKKMHDVEDLLVNSAQGFRVLINNTVGMPMLRTLIRSTVILTTAGWAMFDLYKNVEDMEAKVPQLATSETILQQSNGISFLVTTTSNVQVFPKWFSFIALCNSVGVVLVIVLVYVYSLMVYIQREEDQVVP